MNEACHKAGDTKNSVIASLSSHSQRHANTSSLAYLFPFLSAALLKVSKSFTLFFSPLRVASTKGTTST